MDRLQSLMSAVRQLRAERRDGLMSRFHCNECERNFSRRLGKLTLEVRCPRCGSYDTELRTI